MYLYFIIVLKIIFLLQNAGLRKCILGLFIFMITLFVVAIVVIIVLAPVEQTWDNFRKSMAEKK